MSETPASRPATRADGLSSSAALIAFPLATLLIHLIWIHGYGYFRDELYYLACARHPAWGYVDQPPLSIWVLWVVMHTLGSSLVALRLLPAVAAALVVWLAGLMARALGGGRFAQALAMLAALVPPDFLGTASVFSMNVFDLLFWAVAAYLLIRIFAEDNARLWPWLGLVLGLGLLNKISVLWLGFGLACGLLLTPQRRWLRTRGPWIAGAIAAVTFLPYVLWQIPNHWATLEFIHNATTQKMQGLSPVAFLVDQVNTMQPLTLPIWLAGLGFYFVATDGRRFRPLGIIYVAVLLILVVNQKSRPDYLAPAYTMLFAAGGLMVERAFARPAGRVLRPAALAALALGGAITLPFGMPILPIPAYVAYAAALGQKPSTDEKKALGALPQFYADMRGWPAMVADVARVYDTLPPADRAQAAIFTGNYGEAGAIDLFGPRLGLPPALSGHNNYWIWGPRGYTGDVMIFLVPAYAKPSLDKVFGSVVQAGEVDCGDCMPYEDHQPIYVCRHIRVPLAQMWPRTKHYE